jgi:hypothetical protein
MLPAAGADVTPMPSSLRLPVDRGGEARRLTGLISGFASSVPSRDAGNRSTRTSAGPLPAWRLLSRENARVAW